MRLIEIGQGMVTCILPARWRGVLFSAYSGQSLDKSTLKRGQLARYEMNLNLTYLYTPMVLPLDLLFLAEINVISDTGYIHGCI